VKGLVDRRTGGWVKGLVDRRTGGWNDKLMEGQTERRTYEPKES